MDDALLAALREAFAQDLAEQARTLESGLVALERAEGDARAATLRDVFRAAHGLKGAARAAGVPAVERACHAMESLLGAARDAGRPLEAGDFAALLATVDLLNDAQGALSAGELPPDAPFDEVSRRLEARLGGATAGREPAPPATPAPAAGPSPSPAAAAPRPPEATAPRPPDADRGPVRAELADSRSAPQRPRSVRLSPERLDALAVTGGSLANAAQAIAARAERIDELAGELRRAMGALRGTPAGDLVRRVERGVAAVRGQLEGDHRSLSQRTRRLLDEVRALRLTPWPEAVAGLDRIARDVGNARGKEVEVVVEGEALELDQSVVRALRDPLAHLVRNAVDHGIEAPAERTRAGKPPRGRITLAAEVESERVRVRVADDGRGIDPALVMEAARKRGIEVPADPARALDLLFVPGFSTVEQPDEVSGRGVGLDVVAAGVRAMRGRLAVTSRRGHGATFELTLPATLWGLRAVLVRDAGQPFALSALDVERVVRLRPALLRASEGRTLLVAAEPSPEPGARANGTVGAEPATAAAAGEPVPIAPLAHALGLDAGRWDPGSRRLALVLSARGRRAAVAVEDVVAERELALEPLPGRLAGQPLAAGAAALEGGDLALVISTEGLLDAIAGARLSPDRPRAETPARRRRLVLADDAATTRALGRSILEAAGYEVLTAADGDQAWSLVQQHDPDLVVSDVEMPGMDGFELTRAIRASPRFARLPVVLLTGLASEADRRRGLEAGADAYLVKSAFDQRVLLDTVADLLEAP